MNLDEWEEKKEGAKILGALDCIQSIQTRQVSTTLHNIVNYQQIVIILGESNKIRF